MAFASLLGTPHGTVILASCRNLCGKDSVNPCGRSSHSVPPHAQISKAILQGYTEYKSYIHIQHPKLSGNCPIQVFLEAPVLPWASPAPASTNVEHPCFTGLVNQGDRFTCATHARIFTVETIGRTKIAHGLNPHGHSRPERAEGFAEPR